MPMTITFGCPKCQGTIHAPDSEIGKPQSCPHCQASVKVPAGKGSGTGTIITLLTTAMIVLIGCPLFIVIGLAAVSVMGTKSSGTFTSVGQTIGGS